MMLCLKNAGFMVMWTVLLAYLCHDYELRVFCQCNDEPEVTTPKPIEKPQIGKTCDVGVVEFKEYPGDCHKFLHCQPKGVEGGWVYVEKTCGEYSMFNPIEFNCDYIAIVQALIPSCGKPKPEPELEIKQCEEGKVWSECANQCEHTCHYYGSILRKRGLCQLDEHCKPGCVDSKRPDCAKLGKYWRDVDECVQADECPCMDKAEHYIQPHKPVVGEWEICQCIDNTFTCVPNKLEPTPAPILPPLEPIEPEVTTPKPIEKPQIGKTCDVGVVEYKEYPGDCHKFLHCRPKGVEGGWVYVEKTCGEYSMFNPIEFNCDYIAIVQALIPSCGKPKPEPELEIKQCEEGKVWSECANQCEHTCHYYGSILRKRGLCQLDEHCKPGCVDSKRPDCAKLGKYWRDVDECVQADECPN